MVTSPLALWAHQRAVIPALTKGHYLLLWSMGTGKTAALIRAGATVGGRQLWVTHAVLIPQTLNDIAIWRPSARVQRITSGKSIVDPEADIVIVSYDLMRRVEIWKQLFRLEWDSAVCDEGHALGHGAAARTRAFYGATIYSKGALFTRCRRVWIATGTPVLNSPDELHPHLSRLFPNLIQGFVQKALFLERYCVTIQKVFGPVIVGARNTEELRGILSSKCAPLALKLSDVTDLPPLTVDTLPVEISPPPNRRADVEQSMTEAQRVELNRRSDPAGRWRRGGVAAAQCDAAPSRLHPPRPRPRQEPRRDRPDQIRNRRRRRSYRPVRPPRRRAPGCQ